MARRMSVTLRFDLPDEVQKEVMAGYIFDAVSTMKGSRLPEDPVTDFEPSTMTVSWREMIAGTMFERRLGADRETKNYIPISE